MKKYLGFYLILTICVSHCFAMKNSEQKNEIIHVQNSEGKNFDVVSVNSVKDFDAIPKELGLDYRVTIESTEKSGTYLEGISLDVERVHSQIFIIKDGSSVIGITTLIVTPFKYLSQNGFLQINDGKINFKSIKEILDIKDTNTFVVETGWFHILPKYRNKKLGNVVVNQVLIPTIKSLVQNVYKNKKVLVMCSAHGCGGMKMFKEIHMLWKTYLEKKIDIEIPMPENFHDILGKVDSQAQFTSVMAQKFKFELLPVYNFSLGPVFIKSDFNTK